MFLIVHCVLFTYPSSYEYQCCFHSLAIVNSVAINMHVQIFLLVPAFDSLVYLLRSGIMGSYFYIKLDYICAIIF